MAANNGTAMPRPEVLAMRTYGRVASVFGCIVIGVLFFCGIFSFWDKRQTLLRRDHRTPLYSALSLAAVSVMGFWVELNGAMLWWLDWNGKAEACNNYMYLVTMVYVVMKQFTYLFLFERLKIVHDALNMNMWYLRLVRWTVFLSSALLVGVIFYPLIFVFFRGFVIPEGPCIQYTTSPFPIILFAISDVGLSTLMLGLFIAPLTQHVKRLVKMDETSKDRQMLMAVARRNLIVSSVMMAVTIAVLFFMVHSMLVVSTEGFGHLQLLHTVLAANDALVTVSLCHVLTVSWIPTFVSKCFARVHGGTTSKNGQSNLKSKSGGSKDEEKILTSTRFTEKQIAPASGTEM